MQPNLATALADIEIEKTKDQCKGLVYRAKRSQYIYDGAIGERVYLKLLKRKSCPGCSKCDWMQEAFEEDLSCNGQAVDLSGVEDGKAYELVVEVSPGSYEYPLEVDIEFDIVEFKESTDTT